MLIPIHNSDQTQRKEIVFNRLSELNNYDFGEPHRHDYFELFYFEKGGGVHTIDFQDFEITSHSIHLVTPGQVHQVKRELDSYGFVCLFELDALSAMPEIKEFLFEHICYDVSELNPTYSFKGSQKTTINSLSRQMEEILKNKDAFFQLSIRAIVQGMCVECMRARGERSFFVENDEYADFRKLVFSNFRKIKKVKEYAEALCISEKVLNEQVKKHTGKSASQIIYDQIIREAKRLLLTGISVKEVAYELQFDDPAHFSKFFKNNVGQSPFRVPKNTQLGKNCTWLKEVFCSNFD